MEENAGYEIVAEYPIVDRKFVIGYNGDYEFPYVVWNYNSRLERYYAGCYLKERDEAHVEALERAAEYANYLLEIAKS